MTFNPTDPVFISYRQSDGSVIAQELAWLLRAAGVPVWRDRDDLPPGDTEQRLNEAMAAGLSGAVLVITPEVEKSDIVRFVESEALIKLHRENPDFVLGIANAVRGGTSLDYEAPDRVLAKRPGTLSGVDQTSADRAGLIALVGKIVFERVKAQRDVIRDAGGVFTLSIQTRNTPQVYDRTGADLDIRIRPSAHERIPDFAGLADLADVVGRLPDAITRTAATRVLVTGGAHLSVAFTLGTAMPSTRIGRVDVKDQQGAVWCGVGGPWQPEQPLLQVVSESGVIEPAVGTRPAVAVYLDLLPTRSDAAFERFLDDEASSLAGWIHLRPLTASRLDADQAGVIAAEAAHRIRDLSDTNGNAEIHLLLRCPFPIAVLLGRLTNTLRTTVYEWDDSRNDDSKDHRPRYRPVLDLRTSGSGGVIRRVYGELDLAQKPLARRRTPRWWWRRSAR